jgi:Pyridoxamine 5'-phosphate oxidase
MCGMARWEDVERAEPDFAARVRRLLDAHKHKTMATLRRDGAPRISGIETSFFGGDLWIGSMAGAVKARDLQRDPRMALHSGSADPDEADPTAWPGDAKLAGRAVEITDPGELAAFWAAQEGPQPPGTEESHLFRIEPTEVVLTKVEAPEGAEPVLVIESWHEETGYRRRTRT